MAQYHEVKEITQLEEGLMTFELQPYLDDQFRGQPLTLGRVAMTAGNSPFEPTFRFKVKAKDDDLDAYSLWEKICPPYPANSARWGVQIAGNVWVVSGGILYKNGQPWWYYYRSTWPAGYSYSPTAPPTNWDPNPGLPSYANGFDPYQGEVSFLITRYDSWFPPGDYTGTIEVWTLGNGTPPASAPNLVLQCTIRINKTLIRSPFF
jgi:hypothetical protein